MNKLKTMTILLALSSSINSYAGEYSAFREFDRTVKLPVIENGSFDLVVRGKIAPTFDPDHESDYNKIAIGVCEIKKGTIVNLRLPKNRIKYYETARARKAYAKEICKDEGLKFLKYKKNAYGEYSVSCVVTKDEPTAYKRDGYCNDTGSEKVKEINLPFQKFNDLNDAKQIENGSRAQRECIYKQLQILSKLTKHSDIAEKLDGRIVRIDYKEYPIQNQIMALGTQIVHQQILQDISHKRSQNEMEKIFTSNVTFEKARYYEGKQTLTIAINTVTNSCALVSEKELEQHIRDLPLPEKWVKAKFEATQKQVQSKLDKIFK